LSGVAEGVDHGLESMREGRGGTRKSSRVSRVED
jgi:hypothetical protein